MGIFYHPIAPMWYLYVLIIFYLIFSVLNIKKVTFPVVALCGVVAITSKIMNLNIGVINQLLYHAYFFIMGVYCSNKIIYEAKNTACLYVLYGFGVQYISVL